MRTNLRSFAGGEITPEMYGRTDLNKYQTGTTLCRNFLVLPHGPITRRPGTDYVNEAYDSSGAVRSVAFAYSATQTMVLEFGNLYMRFHQNGQTLLESNQTITSIAGNTVNLTAHGYASGDWVFIGTYSGSAWTSGRFFKVAISNTNSFTVNTLDSVTGAPSGTAVARVYTLTTPYTSAMLSTLRFTQNADVMTIASSSTYTRELRRLGSTNWTLTTVSFVPTLAAPTGVTATATTAQASNMTATKYGVTAIASDGVTESVMSSAASATNNLSLAGNFNTITWSPVAGALRYNVYKLRGGIYGYIGQVVPTSAVTTFTISSAVQNGFYFGTTLLNSLCTVTTATAHGFTNGNVIAIANTGVATMNGSYQVTVTSTTAFTYIPTQGNNASSSTGTASLSTSSLVDDYILADTTVTPPTSTITLNAAIDYPGTVAYFEQRRWFANTTAEPQTVWATRSATESNLTSSLPTRDDDALKFRLASVKQNAIQHLVPMNDLIALTAGGMFRIYADSAPAITPTSLSIKSQGAVGANGVQPVMAGTAALYVQANGARVREITPGGQALNYGYQALDMTLLAPHLFNGYTIVDMAFADEPDKILWCVRSDGVLLGMTYLPDQQVYAWHQHTTDGAFESVCTVSENNVSATYVVVKRTVNGRTRRNIERIHARLFTAAADAFFVDAGLTYSGTAATTITGLWHLEGKTVAALADGAVVSGLVVTSGAITLATAASKVQVGLPFTSDMTTLPLAMDPAAVPAGGRGMPKDINKVFLRVTQSSLVQAGPSFDKLTTYPARAITDPYGSAPALRTGELSMSVSPNWNNDAAICIRQAEPLPLTVLSMALDVTIGG